LQILTQLHRDEANPVFRLHRGVNLSMLT